MAAALRRLWQPKSGLFWLFVAFNALSALGAWALRSLPLNAVAFAVVATLTAMNAGAGMALAWRLVRDPPPR